MPLKKLTIDREQKMVDILPSAYSHVAPSSSSSDSIPSIPPPPSLGIARAVPGGMPTPRLRKPATTRDDAGAHPSEALVPRNSVKTLMGKGVNAVCGAPGAMVSFANMTGPVIRTKRRIQEIKDLYPSDRVAGVKSRRSTDPTGKQEALQEAIDTYHAAVDADATDDQLKTLKRKAVAAAMAYQASKNEKLDVLIPFLHKMGLVGLAGTGSAFGVGRNGGNGITEFVVAPAFGKKTETGFFASKAATLPINASPKQMAHATVYGLTYGVVAYFLSSFFCGVGQSMGQHVVAPLVNCISRQHAPVDPKFLMDDETYDLMNQHTPGWGDKTLEALALNRQEVFSLGSDTNLLFGEIGYDFATGVRALIVGPIALGVTGSMTAGVATSIAAGFLIGGMMATNSATASTKIPNKQALRETIEQGISLDELAVNRAGAAAQAKTQALLDAQIQGISLDELGKQRIEKGQLKEWEPEPIADEMPLVYVKRLSSPAVKAVEPNSVVEAPDAELDAMEQGIQVQSPVVFRNVPAEKTSLICAIPKGMAASKVRYLPVGDSHLASSAAHNLANILGRFGDNFIKFLRVTPEDCLGAKTIISRGFVPLIRPLAHAVMNDDSATELDRHRAQAVSKYMPSTVLFIGFVWGIHRCVRRSFQQLGAGITESDQHTRDEQTRLQKEALLKQGKQAFDEFPVPSTFPDRSVVSDGLRRRSGSLLSNSVVTPEVTDSSVTDGSTTS
jgi:hypothetical protein